MAAGMWPSPAWGMGTTPGAVSSCFPFGLSACHCSATSALLQPMLEATKMALVLKPGSGFQQTDPSCCSLNTTLWVKAYIPIPALLFWEVCYKQLWPAQTENMEEVLLFTTQLSTTANKKCTSHIIIAISFSRYALSGGRALTACNKFGFYEKQILRYTTFVTLNFPLGTYCWDLRWLAFYPQNFSLNGLPVICLRNFGSL